MSIPPPQKKAFNPEQLDDALTAPRWEFDYEQKLLILQSYMMGCAECIHPDQIQVVDPQSLLKRFEEVYLGAVSLMRDIDTGLTERLSQIEHSLQLSQNVMRLGAVATREFTRPTFLSAIKSAIRPMSASLAGITLTLQDNEPQKVTTELLLEVQVALTRLGGLLATGARRAREEWLSVQDVLVVDGYYDPRRAKKGIIAVKLKKALATLTASSSLPQPVKQALERELQQTLNEIEHHKVPWNKVLSRLTQVMLLLAAMVSAGADIDDAYNNVRSALEHISSASVFKPETPQPSLPFPWTPKQHNIALPPATHAHEDEEDEEDETQQDP